jgi:predicted dehydrogenase
MNRRRFIQVSAAAGAAAATIVRRSIAQEGANNKLVVAVMGTNGRGCDLARGFTRQKNATVAYICDPDTRAITKGIEAVTDAGGETPQGIRDFRQALDDPNVDVLACAAPNHWHAPATILACSANKHVYVEKPACHTPQEGEWMVEAARKHSRVVQLGTQRRSSPMYREMVAKIHDGIIGPVLYSKSWYNNGRGSIGQGKTAPVPKWLDYALWQGPVTERPYQDNVVHYNWHWFWHWGNGELGNNGIHSIDVCRWAMGVDFPESVAAVGGRFRYDDDQETPDTLTATYRFASGSTMIWEGLSWSPQTANGFGMEFRGEGGVIAVSDGKYQHYDERGKLAQEFSGPDGEGDHFANFLDSIREDKRPHADIEEGHKSTLLCHLGNIAYRQQKTLQTDPANGHIKDDADAAAMWNKDYREGWRPVV